MLKNTVFPNRAGTSHKTMDYRGIIIAKLVPLVAIVIVCFLALALPHSCLGDGHEDMGGSDPHCLICSIIGHTIPSPDPCDCFAIQALLLLPILVERNTNGNPVYRESLPPRAPPPSELG